MELDGTVVAAIGTVATGIASGVGVLITKLGSAVMARLDKVEGKLDLCTKAHASDREEIGGLRATVGILSRTHGIEVQKQVQQTLDDAQVRADAAKKSDPTP